MERGECAYNVWCPSRVRLHEGKSGRVASLSSSVPWVFGERFLCRGDKSWVRRIADVAAQRLPRLANGLTQRASRRLDTLRKWRVVRSSDEAEFEAVSEQRGGESDARRTTTASTVARRERPF